MWTSFCADKNDQFGAGQLAHIASLHLRVGACPVHLLSGWLRLRKWFAVHRDHARRLFGSEKDAPLIAGLGMSASWKRVTEGRNSSPRRGGSRLYLANGMFREASQELGGWKALAVMENVYNKACSEELVPEMRSTFNTACTLLGVQASVVDLGDHSCVDGKRLLVPIRGQPFVFGPAVSSR